MVMIVANPIFEEGRRSGRLNAPDQPFGRQKRQRVVYRLQRDGADLSPDHFSDGLSRTVRSPRDRAQHGQPLRGDVDAAPTKKVGCIGGHCGMSLPQSLE
jgi:hypothetical protein